jgi:hypothetical protein
MLEDRGSAAALLDRRATELLNRSEGMVANAVDAKE